MRVRIVEGKPTIGDYDGLKIPSKSGYTLNACREKMTVSANKAYPTEIRIGESISKDESYKRYGFSYFEKSDNILLPDTYLQLLKDHNIQ